MRYMYSIYDSAKLFHQLLVIVSAGEYPGRTITPGQYTHPYESTCIWNIIHYINVGYKQTDCLYIINIQKECLASIPLLGYVIAQIPIDGFNISHPLPG